MTNVKKSRYSRHRRARDEKSARPLPGRLQQVDYAWLFKEIPGEFAADLEGKESIEVNKGSPLATALQQYGLYWWNHYELTFPEHLAVLFCVTGWRGPLEEAAKQKNPTKAFLEFAKIDLKSKFDDSIPNPKPEEISLVFNFLIGLGHSLEAIGLYGLSINELLSKARKTGDITHVKHAIGIDRTVVATPTAARFIAQSQLQKDHHALNALFKRAKPHERRRTHSDLRHIERALWECDALKTGVPKEVIDMIVKDLGGYADIADAGKNIRQLFTAFRKDATI